MTPLDIRWMGKLVSEIKEFIDVFLMPSSNAERQRLFPLKPYSNLFFIDSCKDIGLCSNPQIF